MLMDKKGLEIIEGSTIRYLGHKTIGYCGFSGNKYMPIYVNTKVFKEGTGLYYNDECLKVLITLEEAKEIKVVL